MLLKIKFVFINVVLFGVVFLISSCGCGDGDSQNYYDTTLSLGLIDENTNEELISGFSKYLEDRTVLYDENRFELHREFFNVPLNNWTPDMIDMTKNYELSYFLELVDVNEVAQEDTIRIDYTLTEKCNNVWIDQINIFYNDVLEYSGEYDTSVTLKI